VARLFAPTSFVNVAVPASPALDPASQAIVDKAILPYAGNANLSNSDWWGIPVAYADAATQLKTVTCYLYWCDRPMAPQRIPAHAAPTLGSDHHLAVIDAAAGTELALWAAENGASGWRAGVRWLSAIDGSGVNCRPGETVCGGANVAGFSLTAGIVRPEEIAQGHIDHALMITTPYTRSGYVACPAANSDGQYADPAAMPVGARLQLDPALDVNALAIPTWKKVVARALQQYGAYVVDTGGSLSIRAESTALRGYDAWAKVGVPRGEPNMRDLPWSRMRVLSHVPC
jgi:hypothetical protein